MPSAFRVLRRAWHALFLLPLIATAAPPAPIPDIAQQRSTFRAALAAAAGPDEGAWQPLAAELEAAGYPLLQHVELAALRSRLKNAGPDEMRAFLERWPGTLVARDAREAWLRERARAGDWPAFNTLWVAETSSPGLRCSALRARLETGGTVAFDDDFLPLWDRGGSLPDDCRVVAASLREAGQLPVAAVWARIDRLAGAGSGNAVLQLVGLLPDAERADARRIATAIEQPGTLDKAAGWPDTRRGRDAIAYGLARHARRNSAAAAATWAALEPRFDWDAPQRHRILNAIALYRASSFAGDALARLEALPAGAEDDATREWRVRVALASGDMQATLAALDRLSPAQAADSRWSYLRARVLDKLGRTREAAAAYARTAGEATFHGFLAADFARLPYAICPQSVETSAQHEARLAAEPGLVRAFELHALDMFAEARREWAFAMESLDEADRDRAAVLAWRRGWYDRAVFAFSAEPRTQRVYEQRFPLAMDDEVRRAARSAGVDPALAYAIIRAESAWMSDARSHADARGLMQLLPAVGQEVARNARLPWRNANDLYEPAFNVQLGTRYLGRMQSRYDGSPWLAAASYNAGQVPVNRWLEARGKLEPDFFIETIPYKETREYVARVLAFTVIYDWRLNGRAVALTQRLPRPGQAFELDADTPRKAVACPAVSTAGAP